MCYAKPGPRCSSHALDYLNKAKKDFKSDPSEKNREALATALEDYKTSPAGIKEMREAGKEEANLYQQKRSDLIAKYKAERKSQAEEAEAEEPEQFSREYSVPLSSFESAQHQIDLANRRLGRNGIEERFEMVNVERFTETRGQEPDLQSREMVKFQLNRPKLKIGGWQVAGRVDALSDGSLIAMTGPDTELGGWSPDHQECDHCGTVRRRNNTYLLQGEDGEIKQVGSNCLQAFTGIRPQGMWALEYDLEAQLDRRDEEGSDGWRSGGWASAYSPESVVGLAVVLSDEGRSYRSRQYATDDREATSDTVSFYLDAPARFRERPEYRSVMKKARSEEVQTRIQEILQHAQSVEGDTDYSSNLRRLASQETIGRRHVGILASAVASWRRTQDREQERASRLNEWFGTVGQPITDHKATVTGLRYIDGQYGTTTLVSLKDEEGRTFKWFASGHKSFADSQKVMIERATVKKHDEYRGNKQTVLTRARLSEID